MAPEATAVCCGDRIVFPQAGIHQGWSVQHTEAARLKAGGAAGSQATAVCCGDGAVPLKAGLSKCS